MDSMDKFVIACLSVGLLCLIVMFGFFPKVTLAYKQGVKDTHKEAFEHGLMVKEITKDDKVVYRWIETHKLGYE